MNLSQLEESNAHRVSKQRFLQLLNLSLLLSFLVLILLGSLSLKVLIGSKLWEGALFGMICESSLENSDTFIIIPTKIIKDCASFTQVGSPF